MGFVATAYSNTRVRNEENKTKIKQFEQGMKKLFKLQSWSRPRYFMIVTTSIYGRDHNTLVLAFCSVVVTTTPCVSHFAPWSRP